MSSSNDLPPDTNIEADQAADDAHAINSAAVLLLADDDEDDRLLTSDALREANVSNPLHFVANGEELMDYLHREGKFAPPALAPRPSVVFLDLNMPRKDGREALREIKGDASLKSIVVVVLTTSKNQLDVDQAYDDGANAYVVKPVTFTNLVNTMHSICDCWLRLVKLPSAKGDE